MRERDKGFWLITMLLFLHTAAAILVSVTASHKLSQGDRGALAVAGMKDALCTETIIWTMCLVVTGSILLYDFVVVKSCAKVSHPALKVLPVCFVRP